MVRTRNRVLTPPNIIRGGLADASCLARQLVQTSPVSYGMPFVLSRSGPWIDPRWPSPDRILFVPTHTHAHRTDPAVSLWQLLPNPPCPMMTLWPWQWRTHRLYEERISSFSPSHFRTAISYLRYWCHRARWRKCPSSATSLAVETDSSRSCSALSLFAPWLTQSHSFPPSLLP